MARTSPPNQPVRVLAWFGVSVRALAADLGVSGSTLYRWLNRRNVWSEEFFPALAARSVDAAEALRPIIRVKGVQR